MSDYGTCIREGCARPLKLAGTGRIPKFCSGRCRVAAHRAKRPPEAMTSRNRWVRWKPVPRFSGKVTKAPLTPSGALASSTNAKTWSSFAAVESATHIGVGTGFVLGDGIGCIDLDHCLVDGELLPWAQTILDRCPPTFTEVSPSGDGLHIFGLLEPGPGRGQRGGDGIEFYSTGRYMTITGIPWPGSTRTLADLNTVVATL